MENDRKISIQIGGGIFNMVFIVFLVLKLTDYIDWSWWWVTSPLWIPMALTLGCLAIWGLLVLIIGIIQTFIE